MLFNLNDLSEPFPQDAIEWRAQTMKSDGTAALALAYIQRKHVIDRLNEVCGIENWSASFTETARGRVICTLSIYNHDNNQWVSKSDGAGDTQVEAEKGAITDAFKRAASMWGIGLYLYDIPAPWVPCTFREKDKKKYFNGWAANPWDYVKLDKPKPIQKAKPEPTPQEKEAAANKFAKWFIEQADQTKTIQEYDALNKENEAKLAAAMNYASVKAVLDADHEKQTERLYNE